MKTPSRRDHPRPIERPVQPISRGKSGSVGRWAFNLATESLYALSSGEGLRRVAYRRADGSLRFL